MSRILANVSICLIFCWQLIYESDVYGTGLKKKLVSLWPGIIWSGFDWRVAQPKPPQTVLTFLNIKREFFSLKGSHTCYSKIKSKFFCNIDQTVDFQNIKRNFFF